MKITLWGFYNGRSMWKLTDIMWNYHSPLSYCYYIDTLWLILNLLNEYTHIQYFDCCNNIMLLYKIFTCFSLVLWHSARVHHNEPQTWRANYTVIGPNWYYGDVCVLFMRTIFNCIILLLTEKHPFLQNRMSLRISTVALKYIILLMDITTNCITHMGFMGLLSYEDTFACTFDIIT